MEHIKVCMEEFIQSKIKQTRNELIKEDKDTERYKALGRQADELFKILTELWKKDLLKEEL